MRNIILPVIFILLSLQNLSAQVKGIVVDSANNKPVEKAVAAMIIKSNITDTIYTISNENGEFSFEIVPPSDFSVIITNVGYRPAAKFIHVNTPEKTISLGNIILVNAAKVMDEVIIETSPITIKEDTIEYRADAFKVKENAIVEDLLKKLPGVQVDKDGNIKAQGKAVTKVKVNGKDFFGGDPKTATKELPANIVDKVQIVDDYGDQATISGIKDGEPEKVMNIQLKKDKNTGYFGRATAGAGTQQRYQASFNGNYFKDKNQISAFFNSNNTSQSFFSAGNNRGMGNMIRTGQEAVNNMGGTGPIINAMNNGDMQFLQGGTAGNDGITTLNSFGINYRDEWSKNVNVYGSYSYTNRNTSGYKIAAQQNITSAGTFFINQDNNFVNLGETHRLYFNIEWNIDSFNYIKISPAVSYGKSSGNSKTTFDYSNVSTKTSEGFYNAISNSNTPNFSGSILFNHRFHKRGRNFSLNINAGTSQNLSEQDSRNNTIQYVPSFNTNQFLFNSQQNDNYNYGIRLTYTEPLSKVRFLDLAFSHNLSHSENDKEVYKIDPLTDARIFNAGLSNDYANDFFSDRANISIRTTEKKYNYTLGVSVQPVNLNGISVTKDSAYHPIKKVNIFPVARFSYNFSKSKSLTINYRGDAQQPGFSQLQDVTDSSNILYLRRGNPDLKPSINHSINLLYNNFNFISGRAIFTNLSFSTIQNQIISNTTAIGTSGAQITMPENVNGYYNVNGFYNFSHPYKNRKYIISLNGNVNYIHNINLLDNIKNTGNNWIIGQGLNFEFNHKDWLEFAAGANYNLNIIGYSNSGNSLLQNEQYSSWSINSNFSIDIPKNWILKYDFEYTINNGLTGSVATNPVIMNASLEKQLFKKKTGTIRLQAYDLLNQSSNISRTVNANSIIDSRNSRLNRFFLLTFSYKLQKFSGKQSQPKANTNTIRAGG